MIICKDYDNSIRCAKNERLDHLYEQCCDRLVEEGSADHPAVISQNETLSFSDLDARANQLARHLKKQGIKSGDRVGLLLDRSYHAYVALLAVLKVNAAYVPLDRGFPEERIEYIVKDAEVSAIVTLTAFVSNLKHTTVPLMYIDFAQDEIMKESGSRLTESEKGPEVSQLSYIIYTSGSTGNPKGVAVEHTSICNFVKVAAEVYGYTKADRVYQGMTIAFDFSVEELWVPLLAGATLIPGKAEGNLVGSELTEFLLDNEITALCCVPTLLATLEDDLPALRFLLVSGEACPQDLIARWHREGRRIINAYGPTEATVTCTWTELVPQKPVTIGKPLPTYSIVILDPDKNEELPDGTLGEVCVAGIGLARGYVNRDDLTEKAFIPDFLNLPNNPSRRIYRTGDLGRINADGEIEYHGRIDTQVKIRGYRIELTEIESAFLHLPQIAQAVASTYSQDGGTTELVAYYTLKDQASELSNEEIAEALHARLPGYMVPVYIEKVSSIPMSASHKADRKKLPPPKGPRFVVQRTKYVAPKNRIEKSIADTVSEMLKLDRISVEDNLFEDLGVHSLLIAQLSVKLRKKLNISNVAMREIYMHPTVRQLASYLQTKPKVSADKHKTEEYRVPGRLEYFACGALQLCYYFSFFFIGIWMLLQTVPWVLASNGVAEFFFRTNVYLAGMFFGWIIVSIAMKWILFGRFNSDRFPIWGLEYFRFWVVKQLIETSPIVLFKGYPIFNVYLRLLGAKIGKNVVIETRSIPICADLINIGDGTILRRDSFLISYKARSNYIHTGSINIGKNVVIGEGSAIDIDTVIQDNARLDHASSLHERQTIPSGMRYHGSPAQEFGVDKRPGEQKYVSGLRQFTYSVVQLLAFFFAISLSVTFVSYYIKSFGIPVAYTLTLNWATEILTISSILFTCFFALRLLLVALVPRLLQLFLAEGKVYVLYGFHYFIFKALRFWSNSILFNILFGDSSYIIYYLKMIGYKLRDVVQTGINFGLEQRHDNPFLARFGKGTVVSDGFWLSNLDMSNTAFRLTETSIGADNLIGNNVYYPTAGKTGNNCLIATKALVPIDGDIRENVMILGSPSIEIPRSAEPDEQLALPSEETYRPKGIRRKNAHNLRTIIGFLLFGFVHFYLALLLIYAASSYSSTWSALGWVVSVNFFLLFAIVSSIALERGSLGFGRLKPIVVSVYDKEYWPIERLWKYSETFLRWLWLGTPFRSIISRLLGIKVGKMVFDDGMYVSEKTLVEIGDYCNLNESVVLQSHSLEQGEYKSGYIQIGNHCSIECNAFLHYGCTIGDNVIVAPDTFIMKGENVESNSTWWGNPAISKIDLPHLIDTRGRIRNLIRRLHGITVNSRTMDLIRRLEDVAIKSRMAELIHRLETLSPKAMHHRHDPDKSSVPED
ncbi:MAG: Pls/PosA family non-ribosomal peptide synthetase [Arenicellales bacterium]